MKLYIRHSGQEVGPYSLEEVRSLLSYGSLLVTDLPINHDGQVIHLGSNLLAPANPVWHGQSPKIVYPE